MNPIISQQLKAVKFAHVPPYDDNTTKILISKQSNISDTVCQIGHYYEIEVENYIINPPENFDLHKNWNRNIIPKDHCMRCEVIQLMGKMVKINGIGFNPKTGEDTNNSWEGWLPRKSIKYFKEIN